MKRPVRLAILLALVAGCGGRALQLDAREGSVHDALTALGYAETGARSEASLDEGGTLQFPLHVEAGECRAIVAIGSSRVDDLEIEVLRADGMRVARDESHGRDAAAMFCASSTSDVEVVVTAEHGHGEVSVSVFDGGAGGGRASRTAYGSSCESAETIEPGTSVSGSTADSRHRLDGSCFEGGSPEIYYRLEIAVPSMVTFDLQSNYDGAVYVLRDCAGAESEIGCNDDAGSDRRHSHLDVELEPGSYIVVVDGFGGESGNFDLRIVSEPLVPLSQICQDAPALVPGQAFSGTTVGAQDRFRATCANGARGGDRVHRLSIAEPSRVRVVQQSSDHDGALFLRRACEDESSEVACNDDWNGIETSVVTTTLDAGTYFVYSDAYESDEPSPGGAYSITADVAPIAGRGDVPSDACGADVLGATPGESVTVDTFTARDDLRGSCGGQGGADVVRRVRVATRSNLRVVLGASQFSGHAYLRRASCDGEEIACRGFGIAPRSDSSMTLEALVEPGDYFLVIDGADVESFGTVDVKVELVDLAATERACNESPLLTPGRDVRGTTSGRTSMFEASCANGARSGDQVYRLVLRRRSFVTLSLESEGFDGALHMRRGSCASLSSEVACNDDAGDVSHSRIEGNFDAGTYYVVVDGYDASNAGAFSLRADVAPERPGYRPPEEPGIERDHDDDEDGNRLKMCVAKPFASR